MKYSRLRLPWQQLDRGQGFFVPCLDTNAAREYVLKQAVLARMFHVHATPCIIDGLIGVWFFRPPQRTP